MPRGSGRPGPGSNFVRGGGWQAEGGTPSYLLPLWAVRGE
jgi:hypothetical protein